MARLVTLLVFVIFLAGCADNQTQDMKNSTANDSYTINRGANGVYIYTDKQNKTDLKIYFPANS